MTRTDDELRALCEDGLRLRGAGIFPVLENAKTYWSFTADNFHLVAKALLDRLTQPTFQTKLTDSDCDEIARYVGVPALKLRNAMAVVGRLTQPMRAPSSVDLVPVHPSALAKEITDLAAPYAVGRHSGSYDAIRDVEILARVVLAVSSGRPLDQIEYAAMLIKAQPSPVKAEGE